MKKMRLSWEQDTDPNKSMSDRKLNALADRMIEKKSCYTCRARDSYGRAFEKHNIIDVLGCAQYQQTVQYESLIFHPRIPVSWEPCPEINNRLEILLHTIYNCIRSRRLPCRLGSIEPADGMPIIQIGQRDWEMEKTFRLRWR